MRTAENGKGIDHDRYAWARFEQKRIQNVQGIAELQSGLEGILEALLNASPERHAAAVDMLEPVLRKQQLQAVVLEELLEDLLRAQRAAKVELATAASAWPRARGEDQNAARAVLEDCSRAAFCLLCAAGGHCGSEEEQRRLLLKVPLSGAFCDEASFFLRDVQLRLNQEVPVESIDSASKADQLAKQLEALQRDKDDLEDMLSRGNEVLSSSADSWLCLAEKAAVDTLIPAPTNCAQPDVSIISWRSSGSTATHPQTFEAETVPHSPRDDRGDEETIIIHEQNEKRRPSNSDEDPALRLGGGSVSEGSTEVLSREISVRVLASPTISREVSPRVVSPPSVGASSRSPQKRILKSSSAARIAVTPERSRQTLGLASSLRGVGATPERRQIIRMSSAPSLQRCGPARHASPTKRLQQPRGYSAIVPAGVSSEKTKQALLRTDADRRTEPLRSPQKKKNVAAPGKPLVVTIAQRAPAVSSTSPVPVAMGGSILVPGTTPTSAAPAAVSGSITVVPGTPPAPAAVGGSITVIPSTTTGTPSATVAMGGSRTAVPSTPPAPVAMGGSIATGTPSATVAMGGSITADPSTPPAPVAVGGSITTGTPSATVAMGGSITAVPSTPPAPVAMGGSITTGTPSATVAKGGSITVVPSTPSAPVGLGGSITVVPGTPSATVAMGGSITVVPGCRARLNKSLSSPVLKVLSGNTGGVETPVSRPESRGSSFTAAPMGGQRTPCAGYPAGPIELKADDLRPTRRPASDVPRTLSRTPSHESAVVRETSLSRSHSDRIMETSLFSLSDGNMGSQRSPCFYPPPITSGQTRGSMPKRYAGSTAPSFTTTSAASFRSEGDNGMQRCRRFHADDDGSPENVAS